MCRLPLVAACVFLGAAASAQRPIDELIADLASRERALSAQLELRARAVEVARPLAAAFRSGWPGAVDEAMARGAAARVLMEIGSKGASAFDELVECLRDPDLPPESVRHAGWALTRIGPFAGVRRTEIAADLRTPNARWRWRGECLAMGADLLGALDFDARDSTLDEILAAIAAGDPCVCPAACAALIGRRSEFTGSAARIVEALAAALVADAPESILRARANEQTPSWHWSPDGVLTWRTELARALLAFAPDDARGWLGASQRLFDLDLTVRVAAATWLGDRRVPDSAWWLFKAARDDVSPEVALAALSSLQRIGPSIAWLAPRIATLDSVADERVRKLAASVARMIAPGLESRADTAAEFELLAAGLPPASAVGLAAETRRLLTWLDGDGGRRFELLADERRIAEYDAMPPAPRDAGALVVRWVPVRVLPDPLRPSFWGPSLSATIDGVVDAAPSGTVGPMRERLRTLPWIIELIPVDAGETRFTVAEARPTALKPRSYSHGAGFSFVVRPACAAAFAEWVGGLGARRGSLLLAVDGLCIAAEQLGPNGNPGPRMFLFCRDGTEDRLDAIKVLFP